jgi:hypothetical protein
VLHATLHRPETKPFNVDPLSDTYRAILVPAEGPIYVCRLIEENGPHGAAARPQSGSYYRSNRASVSEKRLKIPEAAHARARSVLWKLENGVQAA